MGSLANGRYCCVDGQIVPHFFNSFLPLEVLVPHVLVLGHRGREHIHIAGRQLHIPIWGLRPGQLLGIY